MNNHPTKIWNIQFIMFSKIQNEFPTGLDVDAPNMFEAIAELLNHPVLVRMKCTVDDIESIRLIAVPIFVELKKSKKK